MSLESSLSGESAQKAIIDANHTTLTPNQAEYAEALT